MADKVVNFLLDELKRDEFKRICHEHDLKMAQAFRAYVDQVLETKTLTQPRLL